VLNSVMLYEAIEHGLDAAIVNAKQILPLNRIPEEQLATARDLIYDRRRPDYDPLTHFISLFEGVEAEKADRVDRASLPVEERLRQRIVDGDRRGIEADLDEALGAMSALTIINEHLLDGMRVVGDLFGSGKMQLPFVLQSAETMKTAVAYLEPHMERAEGATKGKIVLATVRGDVHDIGKNLVDIILSNNGYTTYNLGIKQPIGNVIERANEVGADAIGLSGLLVKSTVVMREDLEELNTRELFHYPVLLGGAALTR
jgi:5-methyltetrahydrofolate--homocysteine methyltransferase